MIIKIELTKNGYAEVVIDGVSVAAVNLNDKITVAKFKTVDREYILDAI